MATICLYFHLHLSRRFRPFSLFEIGHDLPYFDESAIQRDAQHLTDHILPPLLRHAKSWFKQRSDFCFSLVVSGITLNSLRTRSPKGWQQLQALVDSGRVELIAQPYYHSFSFLKDRTLFEEEIRLQQQLVEELQGHKSVTLANPALLYNNYQGYWARSHGIETILVPGGGLQQSGRHPYQFYHPPHSTHTRLLPVNEGMSHAFEQEQLDSLQLNNQIDQVLLYNPIFCMGLDLMAIARRPGLLPDLQKALEPFFPDKEISFQAPRQLENVPISGGEFDVPFSISDRQNLQAWLGNPLQQETWRVLFQMKEAHPMLAHGTWHDRWTRLLDSQYLLNMQGDFSQQDTSFVPLDAYRKFRTILADFDLKLRKKSS